MAQLFFKYGAMNSGKSIEILKVAHNYEEQDKPVLLFTSAIEKADSFILPSGTPSLQVNGSVQLIVSQSNQ